MQMASQADVGQDRREKSFFQGGMKVSKNNFTNWVHRRPFRQSLAGIFGNFKLLAFHCCHRSYHLLEKMVGILFKLYTLTLTR